MPISACATSGGLARLELGEARRVQIERERDLAARVDVADQQIDAPPIAARGQRARSRRRSPRRAGGARARAAFRRPTRSPRRAWPGRGRARARTCRCRATPGGSATAARALRARRAAARPRAQAANSGTVCTAIPSSSRASREAPPPVAITRSGFQSPRHARTPCTSADGNFAATKAVSPGSTSLQRLAPASTPTVALAANRVGHTRRRISPCPTPRRSAAG